MDRYYDKEEWYDELKRRGYNMDDINYVGNGSAELFDDGVLVARWEGFYDLNVTEMREFGCILDEEAV